MHGTLAIRIRGDLPGGFIARINMPDGKLANMVFFLKVLNCIRADSMTINQDSLKITDRFIHDIKRMIQKASEAACVGFMQLGASLKVTTVVAPRIDLSYCPGRVAAGDSRPRPQPEGRRGGQALP